ncbi:MAG: hypothetical protein IBX41_01920, partial [Methanophagales archaeon]|nr:hypothetical protein [Methanophagales archaeon]
GDVENDEVPINGDVENDDATGTSDVGIRDPGYVYLEKVATKVPKIYNIGETITYSIVIWNPNTNTPITITVVNDTYANDGYERNLLAEWGIPNITLPVSDNIKGGADTYNNTWTAPRPIAAGDLDPVKANQVINRLRIAGIEDVGELDLAGSVQEAVMVTVYPPNFNFTFDPTCCLTMTFSGSASFDPDGTIENHTWDFGDSSSSGVISGAPGVISHIYASCGSKTVKLSGYDNLGLFNFTEKEVYVPCAPTAVARVDKPSVLSGAGEVVTFSGCDSHADENAPWLSITGYTWTFSDGYPTQSTHNVTRMVDGPEGTSICATLEVTDGHCNDTAEVCVYIVGVPQCKIRLYGTFDEGPGNLTVTDPEPGPGYGLKPENPPYTCPMGPFDPQHEQAPRKDFITFNPAIMDHNQGYPELSFKPCESGAVQEPKEKVFKRMWYEKEWFKDHDNDGCWDVVIDKFNPITGKYEYNRTMCLEEWNEIPDWIKVKDKLTIREWNNDPTKGDIYGPAIKQEFTYMFLNDTNMPIMIQSGSRVLIPMAHDPANPYRGLNSFDADGDGKADYVRVESEATLGLDIDHDGTDESMDMDGIELNGNESVVLVLPEKTLKAGGELQFFDHKVRLEEVFGPYPGTATFVVSDNEGGGTPESTEVSLEAGEVAYFKRGLKATEGATFYLRVIAIDWPVIAGEAKARIEVGRMFGQTHANIGGANPHWSQKAFIVDEVFYNVVAIKAEDNCIKYITFRQKLPKMPIKLYGKDLKVWEPGEMLPEMPPFNMPHEICVDVQAAPPWTIPESQQDKIGENKTRPPLMIYYTKEDDEMRYKGELKEIYNETRIDDQEEKEFWMLEWFHTQPQQYTEFALPGNDRYLVTLSWYAPESEITIWDGCPDGPVANYTGERVKFWYEDCTGPLYIDPATSSIRVFGTFDEGPGNHSAIDPETGKKPENPPYTDPMGPFWQGSQAPVKDFITFNPAIMDHNQGYPELSFKPCESGAVQEPKEKVFKRMWYEKEWFKDHDNDGCWDVVIDKFNPITGKYEYNRTMCLEEWNEIPDWIKVKDKLTIREWNNDPTKGDIYGPAIKQEFTYMFLNDTNMPIMIQSGSRVLIPMAHDPANPYRGLNSFDADGDGKADYVRVESEATLGLDIDHDGTDESMDMDGIELNGNESVVLVLPEKTLKAGGELQFFDHKVRLEEVFGPYPSTATFVVSDNEGGGTPTSTEVSLKAGEVAYFKRGLEATQGATFYLRVIAINWGAFGAPSSARIEVGRMFGQTHANIGGANPYWSQKAFIVDKVFYNVVAIKAEDNCIKYITFRQKLPKMPIKLYGKHLKVWAPGEILPEMPPFNMPHEICVDVQPTWTRPYSQQDKIGEKRSVGALNITYVKEGEEMRFKGELKEIYHETCEKEEFWTLEWFHTQPQQYTAFVLPRGELYLMTLAWYAPQSEITIWNCDPGEPMKVLHGMRVKFWYDPTDNTDIYVNRVGPAAPPPGIDELYDMAMYGGNGDGKIDLDELVNAILDYLRGTGPFAPGGQFDKGDLIQYIMAYLKQEGYL